MTEKKRGPETVAIFMDGNRRWARRQSLSILAGYMAGKKTFHNFINFYSEVREQWGTKNYIFYAFSTENWQRPKIEVKSIMSVFDKAFDIFEDALPFLHKESIHIRFLGERNKFSSHLQRRMTELERITRSGTRGVIALAISYGGRADILHACNALVQEGKKTILTEDFENKLWTAGIPDPDLIIRPGGEKRLSNFLTWQSTYSELAFSDTLWPDFTQTELETIFTDYASRERRHGE